MAARKLQQEMDRVFKRVAEGVATFDSIYDKVQQSTNQSQKEKLEQDLKREIKKLQRLRDQIKTWMGSNDIKDKKALTDQRKLIETEMERFKACEREMKTKAFSKEGLSPGAGKQLDPREQQRQEACSFVQNTIDELSEQLETLEAEEEQLHGTVRKGRKDNSVKSERLSEIADASDRHKWHIGRLETIARLLENGSLAPQQVMDLQEDIQYYVESNQDVDFAEDVEIYDELNLDQEEDEFTIDEQYLRDEPTSTLEDLAVESAKEREREAAKEKEEAAKAAQAQKEAAAQAAADAQSSSRRPQANNTPPPIGSNMKPAPLPTRNESLKYASAAAAAAGSSVGSSPSTLPQGLAPLPAPKEETRAAVPVPVAVSSTPAPWAEGGAAPATGSGASIPTGPAAASATATASTTPVAAPAIPTGPAAGSTTTTTSSAGNTTSTAPSPPPLSTSTTLSDDSIIYTLPPGLQDLVSSLDVAKKRVGTPPPIGSIAKLLETSYFSCPDSGDAEKPQMYHPESPFPTLPFYPQDPLAVFEDGGIFAKMDIDTLFYIFYYRQGTYHQYLAAKELKSRSWRFHKRFLTWFQRHEEPKVINNEFEQGTYRYFDFEGVWLQRRKSNFQFEYHFLEDEI
ncbi:General negative regulator of transcription subunit 3 [Yarrowia sp. C11]|nr:General negative regulator of transcription subunit 3 [Yarrowia sp. E02]KAG5372043.1 General negative regulator of transcription subunit 3 [Yarrowia sp. C11]